MTLSHRCSGELGKGACTVSQASGVDCRYKVPSSCSSRVSLSTLCTSILSSCNNHSLISLSPLFPIPTNMAVGGCLCGNVRYEVQGEPEAKVRHVSCLVSMLLIEQIICHCLDCRKISGSTYSCNSLHSGESFKVTKGTPKEYKTKGGSGNDVVSAFWCVPVTVLFQTCADVCIAATAVQPCSAMAPALVTSAS